MNAFEKWLGRVDAALLALAAASTLVMMLLTSADALGRYLFNSPITGAYEITEKYLMPALVFLGLGYAYRGGLFIRVTFLADRLPRAAKLAADWTAQLVSMGLCVLLMVASWQQAMRVVGNRTTLSTIELPMAPAYFLVPAGLALLLAYMLLDCPRVPRGESRLFQEGSPDS